MRFPSRSVSSLQPVRHWRGLFQPALPTSPAFNPSPLSHKMGPWCKRPGKPTAYPRSTLNHSKRSLPFVARVLRSFSEWGSAENGPELSSNQNGSAHHAAGFSCSQRQRLDLSQPRASPWVRHRPSGEQTQSFLLTVHRQCSNIIDPPSGSPFADSVGPFARDTPRSIYTPRSISYFRYFTTARFGLECGGSYFFTAP